VRILHTADWHLGKVLKGVDRLPEQRGVMAEIVAVAASEGVDLVVVAGDVFESGAPPPDAQRLAWETLLALRAGGAEVAVIAGNHDSPDAFDAVRPVFAAAGITVLGRPAAPTAGGVVEFRAARTGEAARLALLPFRSGASCGPATCSASMRLRPRPGTPSASLDSSLA
jgi:DNA repair protein SbcD/Mre11